MRAHYAGAIWGSGFFRALRTARASRFSAIRAFVMIPSKGEKLELSVTRRAKDDVDIVTLKRTNWRTGEETMLYNGNFMSGTPIVRRLPRD